MCEKTTSSRQGSTSSSYSRVHTLGAPSSPATAPAVACVEAAPREPSDIATNYFVNGWVWDHRLFRARLCDASQPSHERQVLLRLQLDRMSPAHFFVTCPFLGWGSSVLRAPSRSTSPDTHGDDAWQTPPLCSRIPVATKRALPNHGQGFQSRGTRGRH
jgi:hypothetical protein